MKFKAYVVVEAETERVVYCGITTKSLAQRWARHCISPYAIGRAIRKHGPSHFAMIEVACSHSSEDLRAVEVMLIAQHGTFAPNGYNLTKGGDGTFGLKFSPESIEKLRVSHRGKRWTEGQREKLLSARAAKPHPFMGKNHTPETLDRIRRNLPPRAGEANSFFGKKHSPETLASISGANNHMFGRRLSAEERAAISGVNSHRHGTKHTPETLAKMSLRQQGANNPNFGVPWSPERRVKHMATLATKRAAKDL